MDKDFKKFMKYLETKSSDKRVRLVKSDKGDGVTSFKRLVVLKDPEKEKERIANFRGSSSPYGAYYVIYFNDKKLSVYLDSDNLKKEFIFNPEDYVSLKRAYEKHAEEK